MDILHLIAQAISDKKGANITALDVRGISTLSDYLIIAEGLVDRHVVAIAQTVLDELKGKGIRPLHVAGLEYGDWVVLDFGSVVAHLFLPEMRQKYLLERLWQEASLIEMESV